MNVKDIHMPMVYSHYIVTVNPSKVLPERVTACTSAEVSTRNRSTGVSYVLRDHSQRPIAFIENDSESDLVLSLEGSLFDVLLRSCSSDVLMQVKQTFADSRIDKKTNTNQSSVGVFTSLRAGGKSYQNVLTAVNIDTKAASEPTISRGVCTSHHMLEISVQTTLPDRTDRGNHPLIPKKEIVKTKTNQFDETNEKAEECIKTGKKGPLKEVKAASPQIRSASSASNELCVAECDSNPTLIVDHRAVTTGEGVMKRMNYSDCRDIGRFCESICGRTRNVGTQTSYETCPVNYERKILGTVFEQLSPSTDACRNCSPNISRLFQTEACTMKPSHYNNVACQTQNSISALSLVYSSSCMLSPTFSLTDICGGRDKNDLRTVYVILSAIESRISRLKRNIARTDSSSLSQMSLL